MTNWEKIKEGYEIDKDFAIENYAICKGLRHELFLVPCNFIGCEHCVFSWQGDCREQMREFLEKEVTNNEQKHVE